MNKKFIYGLMLAFAVGGTLQAAPKSRPCAADTQKFCKDVKPGGGRIIACLTSHESELSTGCKDNLAKMKAKAAAAKAKRKQNKK